MCGYLSMFIVFTWCVFFGIFTGVLSKNTDCGMIKSKNQIPWTVGIYLEREKDMLELVCLGTVLKENKVITAAQCVCESLSKEIRKEHIYVSTEIEKLMKRNSNAFRIKRKDIVSRNDYVGFLLNPFADLAVLKFDDSSKIAHPVCMDWVDLNSLLESEKTGIITLWDKQMKTVETSYLDYDSCTLATSEEFSGLLGHDKNCFKVSTPDLVPQSIGSGIFFKNPRDNRWYLEGIVSAKEKSNNEIFIAGTSVRHYLTWLSRLCT